MSYVDFSIKTSWLDLTPFINVPVDFIMNEIDKVETSLIDERNVDQYHKMQENQIYGVGEKINGQSNWSALTLYSASGKSDDILTQGILPNNTVSVYRHSFRNIRQHKWTDLASVMPATVNFIIDSFMPLMKLSYVKISKLDPGGIIPEHKDLPNLNFNFETEVNSYNMLNSILIELNCPDGVIAIHDGIQIPYRRGSVFMFNQSKPHSTKHLGKTPRYNMRIQGLHNKRFRDMIKNNCDIINCHPLNSKVYLKDD